MRDATLTDRTDVEVTEVADGIFAYVQQDGSWWVNTAGVIVRDDDVMVIDTCSTERRARDFARTVSRLTPNRVRRLVNTHSHGDHTYGNAAFDDAVVIGHEICRDEVLSDRVRAPGGPPLWSPMPDWGDLAIRPPEVTFAQHLTLYSGSLRVDLVHTGVPAHTRGDIVVWLPDARVLYTGDLVFNGGTPLLMSGSVTGALDALDLVRSFDAAVLVPGHGRPCTPDVLDLHERYLRFIIDVAERGRAAGISPLEAARETDLGEFAGLLDAERIVPNLHRCYADLDGRTTIDIPAALIDAIAYNGGRPLHCIA
jgi:cyclase